MTGRALLPEDPWDRYYWLALNLELHRAECEFLTGAIADAEERLTALQGRERNSIDRAEVTRLRLDIYTTLGRSDRAVEVALENPPEYLRVGQTGTVWLRTAPRSHLVDALRYGYRVIVRESSF